MMHDTTLSIVRATVCTHLQHPQSHVSETAQGVRVMPSQLDLEAELSSSTQSCSRKPSRGTASSLSQWAPVLGPETSDPSEPAEVPPVWRAFPSSGAALLWGND